MSPHRRWFRLALGGLLLTGALWPALGLTKGSGTFAPFVPQAFPQRALGDLDADGLSDLALIQDRADDPQISVRLSGSSDVVKLGATVAGLIEADIDRDGDLDLVAATPSGEVLIWLNDGHGRFTRREASQARHLSGEPVVVDPILKDPIAFGVTVPLVGSRNRADTGILVAQIRPPKGLLGFSVDFVLLPSLRAPPLVSV